MTTNYIDQTVDQITDSIILIDDQIDGLHEDIKDLLYHITTTEAEISDLESEKLTLRECLSVIEPDAIVESINDTIPKGEQLTEQQRNELFRSR
jgi:regulator of replication initiation timing